MTPEDVHRSVFKSLSPEFISKTLEAIAEVLFHAENKPGLAVRAYDLRTDADIVEGLLAQLRDSDPSSPDYKHNTEMLLSLLGNLQTFLNEVTADPRIIM